VKNERKRYIYILCGESKNKKRRKRERLYLLIFLFSLLFCIIKTKKIINNSEHKNILKNIEMVLTFMSHQNFFFFELKLNK
jgi:hypothetical protein